MTNYIDRILDERSDLVMKANKLQEFIDSNVLFGQLDKPDQYLMHRQRYVMQLYIDLLTMRLDRINEREISGRS